MTTARLEVFFSAHDSLYFRGSRPHSAAGASSLPSDFPPAVTTLSGCIRTRLGDALGACWQQFREGSQQVDISGQAYDLQELIGDGEDTGALEFGELRLYKNGQRLYPVPATLLSTGTDELIRMELGDAVHCDLGNVRLGQLPKTTPAGRAVVHAKPLENTWLTARGLELFLQGQLPEAQHLVTGQDLFERESRLGIGRNNEKATVESGLLYQTQHLRLQDDVEFAIAVSLPSDAADLLCASIGTNPMQRFGGEGRMAGMRVEKNGEALPPLAGKGQPAMLMLLTDMLPATEFAHSPLPGLAPAQVDGVDCWEGELHGVGIRLLNVTCGKSRRIGSWDARRNQPRAVQTFVPAGACFFIEPLNKQQDLTALHGKTVGRRTDFGFGTLVCVL